MVSTGWPMACAGSVSLISRLRLILWRAAFSGGARTPLTLRPDYNAQIRTPCVATQLEAGHAENALPQRARATVNCRILPGEKVVDVQATLAKVVADNQIKIPAQGDTAEAQVPPLTPELMKAVESISAD